MPSGSIDMQCWKCGEKLKQLLLPFSRYEECSYCKADLHACIACKHYDSSVADACREDRADFILEKEKANFCDYFKVNTRAYLKQDDSEAIAARAKLAALFGETEEESSEVLKNTSTQSEADKALAELKRLFGDDAD